MTGGQSTAVIRHNRFRLVNCQSSIHGLLGAGLTTPPSARPKVSMRPTRQSKIDAPLVAIVLRANVPQVSAAIEPRPISAPVQSFGCLDYALRVRPGNHTNPKRKRGSRLLALALRAGVPVMSPAIEPRPISFRLFARSPVWERNNGTRELARVVSEPWGVTDQGAHKPDAPMRNAGEGPLETPRRIRRRARRHFVLSFCPISCLAKE
jgi:hypothetical protein